MLVSTLIQRTRRFLRDWPEFDTTTAAMTVGASSFMVQDATIYQPNWPVEIDQETMIVKSVAGSTVTVTRGAYGSTAASHASATTVLVKPSYYAVEVLDALNQAQDDAYPIVYKEVISPSLTVVDLTYEYAMPLMPSSTAPIPYISKVELLAPGDYAYREWRHWEVRRGSTPMLKLLSVPMVGSTVRVRGYGPFTELGFNDTLDTQFPPQIISALPMGASAWLLASGEAGRTRMDKGLRDDREAAVRNGSALTLSNNLYQRWRIKLQQGAPQPLPPHVVSIW